MQVLRSFGVSVNCEHPFSTALRFCSQGFVDLLVQSNFFKYYRDDALGCGLWRHRLREVVLVAGMSVRLDTKKRPEDTIPTAPRHKQYWSISGRVTDAIKRREKVVHK